ncbi:MAG: precorrin-3B C(17)-methyltransferase [Pseudomonadota bacterium]
MNSTQTKIKRSHSSGRKGKLYVVGIGPGSVDDRTRRAEAAILQSDVVVGYSRYLGLIDDLTHGKKVVSSGMTREVQRCREAIRLASEGQTVSLVSSGDPGVYGMAGLALQLVAQEGLDLDVEIVPGVTAALSAAARLGAPLMLDFCVISLSDLLAPWSVIRDRLNAAAQADMVTALYNPRSKKRVKQLEEAAKIFRKFRDGGTPVGIVTSSAGDNETVVISDLDNFLDHEISMLSVVIIGSSTSTTVNGCFITPRGYLI